MFVIGIPTLNEADNISRLVKQIDALYLLPLYLLRVYNYLKYN